VLSERDLARITALAETIRKTLRAPITFPTAKYSSRSIGLALRRSSEIARAEEVLKDAELANVSRKPRRRRIASTCSSRAMRARKPTGC